jgi:hypothetical protein
MLFIKWISLLFISFVNHRPVRYFMLGNSALISAIRAQHKMDKSQDSLDGIVIKLWAGRPHNLWSIRDRNKDLRYSVQNDSAVQPPSCTLGTLECIPADKAAQT